MEELIQLIVALFLVSFPLLSAFSRRRRARKARRKAAGEEQGGGKQRKAAGEEQGGGKQRKAAGRTSPGRASPGRASPGRTATPGGRRGFGRRRREAAEGAPSDKAAGLRDRPAAAQTGAGPAETPAASAGRAEDTTRVYEIGKPTKSVVHTSQRRRISGAALARIETLPRVQQAVVWSELLGRPKALRRGLVPWDEESGT